MPLENGALGTIFCSDPRYAGDQSSVGLPQADGTHSSSHFKSKGYDNIKPFFQTGTTYQTGVTVNVGGEDGYALFKEKEN
jgi:hypothetical protein